MCTVLDLRLLDKVGQSRGRTDIVEHFIGKVEAVGCGAICGDFPAKAISDHFSEKCGVCRI